MNFFKWLTLVSASAIAIPVSWLALVMSKSSDAEKENFLALVKWLPVTFRAHVTDRLSDKCIMIFLNINIIVLAFIIS